MGIKRAVYSSGNRGKMEILTGRVIYHGNSAGQVLHTDVPIGFFGHVDPATSVVKERNHPLFGKSIAHKVLVFPQAKGSTVGSYVLYALKKKGRAPAALILSQCELIVAVGAIIAEIPTIDQVDINNFCTGDIVTINGDQITIARADIC